MCEIDGIFDCHPEGLLHFLGRPDQVELVAASTLMRAEQ